MILLGGRFPGSTSTPANWAELERAPMVEMKRCWLSYIVASLAVSLVAAPAAAQWTPGGVRLCQSGCSGDLPRVIADGAGGAFVAWRGNSPTTGTDVYLQRITASGVIAPGWPLEGLPVALLTDSQEAIDLVGDGQGGALIVWRDFRNSGSGGTSLDIYAQRIRSDGSIAPGWPLNGAPVSRGPGYQDLPLIAPDGAGGAFIAWDDERDYVTLRQDVYAQHLTASGTVVAGWPANGIPVCTEPAGQFP